MNKERARREGAGCFETDILGTSKPGQPPTIIVKM